MGQNPSWKSNSPICKPEISLISSNSKVHHHIITRWTPSPTQTHINPVQTPNTSMNVKFNIILIPMSRPPMWSLQLRVPHQIPVAPLLASILATCHAHHTPFDYIPLTTCGELCWSYSFSLCILLQKSSSCSHSSPNIPPLPYSRTHSA